MIITFIIVKISIVIKKATHISCLLSWANWKSPWRARVIFSVFFTTSSWVGMHLPPSPTMVEPPEPGDENDSLAEPVTSALCHWLLGGDGRMRWGEEIEKNNFVYFLLTQLMSLLITDLWWKILRSQINPIIIIIITFVIPIIHTLFHHRHHLTVTWCGKVLPLSAQNQQTLKSWGGPEEDLESPARHWCPAIGGHSVLIFRCKTYEFSQQTSVVEHGIMVCLVVSYLTIKLAFIFLIRHWNQIFHTDSAARQLYELPTVSDSKDCTTDIYNLFPTITIIRKLVIIGTYLSWKLTTLWQLLNNEIREQK